ncbi:MAG: DUF4149 domain-containing protein, partial [Planctomycetes bacterium]|nr:DUF4149 domain-containing protein [Planctomycetota bacterium]
MKPARLIHAMTDLCLGLIVGAAVGASVAASVIFGVSREQGFEKHIANTLAGSMFDRLGWPMLVAAVVATVGCLYAAKKPPATGFMTARTRALWKLMGGAGLVMLLCGALTQFYFAPRMADLRAEELLDDINTDTMTPAWVCFDYDPAKPARNAYAGP